MNSILKFLGLAKYGDVQNLRNEVNRLKKALGEARSQVWMEKNTYVFQDLRFYKIPGTPLSYNPEYLTIHWCGEHLHVKDSTVSLNGLYSGILNLYDNLYMMDGEIPIRAISLYEYRLLNGVKLSNMATKRITDLQLPIQINIHGEAVLLSTLLSPRGIFEE